MKGVTVEPFDEKYGNHISGKDSLVVSVYMELSDLKEKLELYIEAYNKDRYKSNGFDWVDNVGELRDSVLSESLDFELSEAISKKATEHLHIAPPETTDWDKVIGFCYSGIGKKVNEQENYNLNLDLSDYLEKIRPDTNVYQKIKRDKLYAMTIDGVPFAICSIYNSLVFQTEYEGKTYILCAGNWYQIETSFFTSVHEYINRYIPISSLSLPDCPNDIHEDEYNELAVLGNSDFCLIDNKMVGTMGGQGSTGCSES